MNKLRLREVTWLAPNHSLGAPGPKPRLPDPRCVLFMVTAHWVKEAGLWAEPGRRAVHKTDWLPSLGEHGQVTSLYLYLLICTMGTKTAVLLPGKLSGLGYLKPSTARRYWCGCQWRVRSGAGGSLCTPVSEDTGDEVICGLSIAHRASSACTEKHTGRNGMTPSGGFRRQLPPVCAVQGGWRWEPVLTTFLRSQVSWVCCFPVATIAHHYKTLPMIVLYWWSYKAVQSKAIFKKYAYLITLGRSESSFRLQKNSKLFGQCNIYVHACLSLQSCMCMYICIHQWISYIILI